MIRKLIKNYNISIRLYRKNNSNKHFRTVSARRSTCVRRKWNDEMTSSQFSRRKLFDFNYTHNYLISTTHTIIWFQLQVLTRVRFLNLKKTPFFIKDSLMRETKYLFFSISLLASESILKILFDLSYWYFSNPSYIFEFRFSSSWTWKQKNKVSRKWIYLT